MNNSQNSKIKEMCFLCGGQMRYLLNGYDYLYKTTNKSFDIYRCLDCGSEQIVPMPNNDQIISFYPKNYYSYSEKSLKKSFFRKIREKLINLSYNKKTKKDFYYLLALVIKPLFHGLPLEYYGNKKFIDVGCGDGYNVNLMSQYGWDAVGFEIGLRGTRGNIIYDIDFSNVDFHGKLFDCIRVWHVLEHVPNPNQFMKKVASIIDKNGKILLEVPNTGSLCAVIFRKYWYGRELPRHLFNFNVKNLKQLVERNGLKISGLSYSSAGGFLGSLQHIINNLFKTNLNLLRNPFIFMIFFPIDILSNLLRMGDCISVIIDKK